LVKARSTKDLGYIGETYVMAKLMRDYNIASVKVPQEFFPYDLITNNGKKLEVKTARPTTKNRKHKLVGRTKTYEWPAWEFRRNPKQMPKGSSDFVVCVSYESKDMAEEPRCFIIPSSELMNKKTQNPREVWAILIAPKRGKPKFWEWENRWDQICECNRQ